tara:strand:+ start:451 stop:942 length:492 start_codon:yes stop_codon:yes gene_type:complete
LGSFIVVFRLKAGGSGQQVSTRNQNNAGVCASKGSVCLRSLPSKVTRNRRANHNGEGFGPPFASGLHHNAATRSAKLDSPNQTSLKLTGLPVSQKFQVNQYVQWNYGGGTAKGQIKESYKERVTKTIKGNDVTRNASDDEPAYYIEQEDGDHVLKSESELQDA